MPGARISVARFVGQIAVGAAGSKLGGGSFENGAITAAFGYLFNEVGSQRDRGYMSNQLRERVETIMRWVALANDEQLSKAVEKLAFVETDSQKTTYGALVHATTFEQTILIFPSFFQLSLPDKFGVLAHEIGHLTAENKEMFANMRPADASYRTSTLLRAETNANMWGMKILNAGRPGMEMPESMKWADKW